MTNKCLDISLQRIWASLWSVKGDNVTIFVDEELGEVPGDVLAFEVRVLAEVLEGRVGGGTVDINFGHGLEFDAILLLEILDLFIRAWLLVTELVGGVSNNLEALLFVLLGELNQALVVRIGQTSLGGDVDNESGTFTGQLLHVPDLLTIDGGTRLLEEVATLGVGCRLSEVATSTLEALETIKKSL